MPQKKNPDIAELVRGKSGRVFGDLMALLAMLKGLPLAYNKDMQEDKEAIFDALDTVEACLTPFIPMIDTMKVLPDNMRRAAAGGFINATDCADYLTFATSFSYPLSLLIPIIIPRRPCKSLITSPILSLGTKTSTS